MLEPSYYQTLEVTPQATQAEIKQSYRRLVKKFHPDSQNQEANHEKVVRLNAAYEIVGNPQRRRDYDRTRSGTSPSTRRHQRTAAAQDRYRTQRQSRRDSETHQEKWYKEVYVPVNRWICRILNPLSDRIQELAADPFDDDLLANFQAYLADCRQYLSQAQQTFTSQPNPAKMAAIAANLYYCLDRIGDGLDELDWFPLNYDEHYLHSGTELFRIADRLRREAQTAARYY